MTSRLYDEHSQQSRHWKHRRCSLAYFARSLVSILWHKVLLVLVLATLHISLINYRLFGTKSLLYSNSSDLFYEVEVWGMTSFSISISSTWLTVINRTFFSLRQNMISNFSQQIHLSQYWVCISLLNTFLDRLLQKKLWLSDSKALCSRRIRAFAPELSTLQQLFECLATVSGQLLEAWVPRSALYLHKTELILRHSTSPSANALLTLPQPQVKSRV